VRSRTNLRGSNVRIKRTVTLAEAKLGPVEEINRLIRENRVSEYRSPNLGLGMRPLEFASGSARWTWENQPPAALNPFGTLQGGYLAVFIDEMFSTAIGSVLEAGEWAVTAEVKISYLKALRPGTLSGSARVIRRTRSLAFLEASVTTPDGALATAASSTWAISRV
jgi:uncharacterized protein (TIGR00369 family)